MLNKGLALRVARAPGARENCENSQKQEINLFKNKFMHSQFITFQKSRNASSTNGMASKTPKQRRGELGAWSEENLAYQDLLKCANCARKLK